MTLPSELVAEFAKITNDGKDSRKEVTVYGTISVQNGVNYVKLDGSDELTPVTSTVSIKDGERVIVTLKQHTAVVTSNLTDPAASSLRVGEMAVTVDDQGIVLGKHTGDIDNIHEALDGIGITISDDKIVIGDHGKLKEIMKAIDGNSEDISGISKKITEEIDVHISGLTAFTNGLKDGTTIINGGCIDTNTLNLSGFIAFGDLDEDMAKLLKDYEENIGAAAKAASDAQGAADDVDERVDALITWTISPLEQALADKITSGDASTLITETLVSSPVIQGGRISGSAFSNLACTKWIEIGMDPRQTTDPAYGLALFEGYRNNYGQLVSSECIFHVYDGDGEYLSLAGKYGYTFLTTMGSDKKSLPQGTWDFSQATVTGLSVSTTATAVFA